MSNVSPFIDWHGTRNEERPKSEPVVIVRSPEAKTRRTIKATKAQVARLRRQVKAEEQRIALEREMYYLSDKLQDLRKK